MTQATIDLAALVVPDATRPRPRGWLQIHDAPTSREALRDGLRQAIDSGALTPGLRLKPSNDLAREVGLGRSTVGAAVHDLLDDGMLERCAGGGKVVTAGAGVPRLVVTPRLAALSGPLEEYEGLLARPLDDDDRARVWKQFLNGTCVAEVSIRSDEGWWVPRPRLQWAEAIGPIGRATRLTTKIESAEDPSGARRLRVHADFSDGRARCSVRMSLAERLYTVSLA